MPLTRRVPRFFLTLLGWAAAGVAASAALLPVNNASFESANYTGANSWTNDLTDADGSTTIEWTGRDGTSSGACFIERIGGFVSHGAAHIGMQREYFVYQDTTLSWEPNTKYTLTVGVGRRNATFTQAGNVSVVGLTNTIPAGISTAEILANDPFLTSAHQTFDASPLNNLTFVDVEVVFQTGSPPPSGSIIVFIGNDSTGANVDSRAHFDNIRLDATSLLDPDGDGLPSPWETANGLDPNSSAGNNGAAGDPDADASPNSQEFTRGTNPQDNDSDNDTALDGAETLTGILRFSRPTSAQTRSIRTRMATRSSMGPRLPTRHRPIRTIPTPTATSSRTRRRLPRERIPQPVDRPVFQP